ncbi:MAG: response regulator transcription factor [Acidobacteria bacterium]|nr:response regulator transcription factor [Acidobacteriota bacterium]
MTTANQTIKVAIIEDLAEVREGLGYLIGGTPGFQFTGGYVSMETALKDLPRNMPDVVLVDIGLPGMDGIAGTREMKARWPDLVVVTLTVYEDDARIFDALCAGASGYLLKRTSSARLMEGLQDAMNGGSPISPEIASKVIKLFRTFRPPPQADYHLTPHETRILKLLVEGHSYGTAAAVLGSAVSTVAFHMRSIYRKLEVHSKSEAVAKALRDRLIV